MTTSAPRKTPAPKVPVALDLDKLEREYTGDEKPAGPFAFNVAGRRVTLIDPAELDWQVAATLDSRNPHAFFGATMKSEDFDHWVSQPEMPSWKVGVLVKAYREHFGIPDPDSGE